MKVKYIGDYYKVTLQKNKVYDVVGVDNGWYKINTELGENALFPPSDFEVIEK